MLALILLALAVPQSDRLPPANPIPLAGADADTAAAMAPVTRLLAAIAARDPAAVQATARADATTTAVFERADGTRTVTRTPWTDFAAHLRPGTQRLEERLTDPAIEVDGDIAMVWSPYVFLIDGKPAHCGTDHISLLRENGHWQIAAVTWTQRTTGCTAG